MSDLWQISTTAHGGDTDAIHRRATQYQIANGAMGCRGTLDEHGPDASVAITLAGIYDQVGDAWREPINAPNPCYTRLTLDGADLRKAKILAHRQTLHLATATFERETTFSTGSGARKKTLTFKSTRFLSADPATPHLGAVTFSITTDKPAKVEIRTGIDYNIWDLNGPHLERFATSFKNNILQVTALTHEARKKITVTESLSIPATTSRHARITARIETKSKQHLRHLTFKTNSGETYTFQKIFAIIASSMVTQIPCPANWGGRGSRPAMEAQNPTRGRSLTLPKSSELRQLHDLAWREKWTRSDVLIEGDPAAQLALRYSIFQLLIAAPLPGSANSIPARALSGQVYKGAIFWDTEMFMLPFFLHTAPDTAAELMRYRIRTLDGARRKALTEGPGYRGAFYAWESQETGDDACSYFNVGDPTTGRLLRTHFRDKQVHISGDVALALWRYAQTTGDDTLLLEGGAEVILECARFYYSYSYYNSDKHRYEILDVIGPDEYHERVNNNAFTSAVARETIAVANALITHLLLAHPETFTQLCEKISLTAEELTAFRELEEKLYVPEPDPRTRVIEQFDTYFKLRDIKPAALVAQKIHPNEYLGAGQGLAVPTQVIKQADVVMMLTLFGDRYDAATKKANWQYYEPRTEHGSSLSACAYALVACEFGNIDFAYKYFLKTARVDLDANYKTYAGTIFIGGSHPAANGGAWMTAVQGFGGLRVSENKIHIAPRLPKKWKTLAFPLTHRGDTFRITLTKTAVTIAAAATNKHTHMFMIAHRELICAPGTTTQTP